MNYSTDIKYAVIDASTSGDNGLIAAKAGVKFRILNAFMIASGAVEVRFKSGAGGTAKTGQMSLTTNSGFALPYADKGWFETAKGESLNLELSDAVSVDGCLAYVEIEPGQEIMFTHL